MLTFRGAGLVLAGESRARGRLCTRQCPRLGPAKLAAARVSEAPECGGIGLKSKPLAKNVRLVA